MQPRILNGRYQIDQILGRGGMATVYLGHDLKLGRPVAIKILHDHYASDPQFVRRFEHEAQSAANISAHPNIVDIYDVGEDNGTPYIVMEYVEGRTLKHVIEQEGPLPVEQAISLGQQIAEGLDAAHRRGLIHRDVKPQNLLVSPDGRARVADFGIAKGERSPGLTDPGITFGTAEYISPEQVQGQPATPQSDLYSLGVVLYEMLTGRLPFSGDSPLAVAMQHLQAVPPAPRSLNAAIPPQLEAIVMQLLSKDPAQRPASARALAQALVSYRDRGQQQTMMGPAIAPTAQPAMPRSSSAGAATIPQRPAPAPAPTHVHRAPAPRRAPTPPPAYYPPADMAEEPQRSGGCAVFILGIALLAGILGLLFLVLQTDFVNRVGGIFSGGAPAPTSVNPAPTLQPTQTLPPEPTATQELVRVPNVVGLTDLEARTALENAGLRFNTTPPVNDPSVPQGIVASQDVAPDSEVPKGSIVTYTVSLGPQVAPLADVTGQPFDVARTTLEAQGFQVQRQDQPSSNVQQGLVISQNPAPQTPLPVGSAVTLIVSQGDVVIIPNIIGADRATAEQLIQSTDGLVLDIVDVQGPDKLGADFNRFRPNEVISATADGQPIINGQAVPRGSRIVLGVRQP